MPSKLY